MKCASSGDAPTLTLADSAAGSPERAAGTAESLAVVDGSRCVCVCTDERLQIPGEHSPSHAQLRAGRMRHHSETDSTVTTCESLRHWQQRWTFRSVRRLSGGGTGNVCNTSPGAPVTISGTPQQVCLPW